MRGVLRQTAIGRLSSVSRYGLLPQPHALPRKSPVLLHTIMKITADQNKSAYS